MTETPKPRWLSAGVWAAGPRAAMSGLGSLHRPFGLGLGLVALLVLAASILLELLRPGQQMEGRPDAWLTVLVTLPLAAYSIVGMLLIVRRPENRIGWLFLIIGLGNALTFSAEAYVLYYEAGVFADPPGFVWVAWVYSWAWILAIPVAMIFALLLFPTGRLASARWRPVAWLALVGGLLTAGAAAIRPGSMLDGADVDNPLGVVGVGAMLSAIETVGMLLFLLAGLAACVSLLLRFRSSRGIERQQLKWFVSVGTLAIGALLMAGLPVVFLGEAPAEASGLMMLFSAAWLVGLAAFGFLPIAVGMAILRYRLYEIDLIIRRTLVYGALTVMLAAVYAGSVLGLQALLRPFTEGSSLAVAASTLAVAALFRPLRAKLQRAVDRRFYRSQYDAQRTLETFGARLRGEVDLDSLTEELRAIVQSTMQPSSASVWMRRP